jgi:hypothetical protein
MDTTIGLNITTILSNNNGRCIELIHRADDPCVWIIRISKKILWFRINPSTTWFMEKQQALIFAQRNTLGIRI